MSLSPRARARLALVVAASAVSFLAGTTNAGAASCSQQVITDWSDNGRVDGVYRLQCYEEAIDSIPLDLRDYTNAVEVIARALTGTLRSQADQSSAGRATEETPEVDASGTSSVPVALLAAGGLALALLAAGAAGHVARRRRSADD